MIGLFENFKILTVGLLMVLGFYFMFEVAIDFGETPEVEAQNTSATTSLEVGNATPSVNNITLNLGSDIRLVEDDATTVQATATITDLNGEGDIFGVYGRLFWSGAANATNCSEDINDCTATTTCATTSCSVNDCLATCTFYLWFPATNTDNDAATTWDCYIRAVDSQASSTYATNTAQGIEVITLNALNVDLNINYGSLAPNAKNDPLDKRVTASTTGNAVLDADISGYHMCTDFPTCTVSTSIAYQQYATAAAVAYDGAAAWTASTGASTLEFTSGLPTATPSDAFQAIWWGTWATQTSVGNYTGANTFTAITD